MLDCQPRSASRRLWPLAALLLVVGLAAGCGSSGDDASAAFAQCGNGRLDGGEGCDDGNRVDEDACTAVCRPARCGDGAIQAGVEQCDGTNIGNLTCRDAGFGTGAGGRNLPGCIADTCQYDFSFCGAAFTPTPVRPTATATPTRTPTRVPTATMTPDVARCGDSLLEPGETCAECPADCSPAACTQSGETATFAVALQTDGVTPTNAQVELAYRTTTLSIPGSGSARDVLLRVRFAPPVPNPFLVNDLDYAVRIDSTRSMGLPVAPAPFATVRFDRCSGAPAPTLDDLACTVQSCTVAGNAIDDCACVITAP